ncbi:MAG: DNA polymerase III subunit gamma/tau [Planctomycetota bacterium]|nr:MAG: DNA polymerase III subunit gamma/tau [Planctomycetota bacterium]
MSYTVLARRYRSQSFDEVVGQSAIARTLARAVEQDRVAHAYLFVGTRGVGKTTMARLLAKALNGGTPEVDRAIMTGADTDVVEIDAASNRGVDEARDLIANCVYRPMRGPYKIYIIDEVHMLTREAFNALLKTMEEPPAHVKFILCTTEPHKVPPTIQSRCQRFDFRTIPSPQIAEHLSRVLQAEGVDAEPELVRLVARMAAGSMRDGLSLLDRVLAAAAEGETLTVELFESLLGLPARDRVHALVGALADQDPAAALAAADGLLAQGVSLEQTIESVVGALHELLVLAACGPETELVDLAGETRRSAAALASRFTPAGLVHMIALCESVARSAKASANPRALVDALVVRLAMTEHVADVAALLKGGAPPARPSGGEPPARQKKSEPVQPAVIGAADADDPWAKVCALAANRPSLRALTSTLRPVTIDADRALLGADDPNILAAARRQVDTLATLFEQALGRPVRIEFDDAGGETPKPKIPGRVDESDPILKNPLVVEARTRLDATVVAIEDDAEAEG